MTLWDLVLTTGQGKPFSDLELERMKNQKEQFLKPFQFYDIKNYGLSILPLVIGYFILKK
tara:strand:- start:499 stop:678 length:180 start_codon:yes stop_codon:yes gene_type:complete